MEMNKIGIYILGSPVKFIVNWVGVPLLGCPRQYSTWDFHRDGTPGKMSKKYGSPSTPMEFPAYPQGNPINR